MSGTSYGTENLIAKKGSTQPLKIETKMSSALAKMWAFSTSEIRSTPAAAAAALLSEWTGCKQKQEARKQMFC